MRGFAFIALTSIIGWVHIIIHKYKYTNTQTHKYTNTQIHKYTRCGSLLSLLSPASLGGSFNNVENILNLTVVRIRCMPQPN